MAIDVKTILERSLLFRGLPLTTLQCLRSIAVQRSFPGSAMVFMKGDPGDALYAVIRGKVRVYAEDREAREMLLNVLKPGDVFGEIALLDGQSRSANARTEGECQLLSISRTAFLGLLSQESELVVHVLRLLCARIRWTSGMAEDFALLPIAARLAQRILAFVSDQQAAGAAVIELRLSQEELASSVGLSRQAVNQYLQQWKVKRVIDLGRGRLTIANLHGLRRIASGSAS